MKSTLNGSELECGSEFSRFLYLIYENIYIDFNSLRRTHAAEHEEQLRQQASKEARLARDKELKSELALLEIAAEEERRRKRLEKESRRQEEAKEAYDRRWKDLLGGGDARTLKFEDVPWPLMIAQARSNKASTKVAIEDFTEENISAFLLPQPPASGKQKMGEAEKKERKEKLRETMLRYHPDKFVGRFMSRVWEDEKTRLMEAVEQVVRVLNVLMTHT
jgi:hypothetical protein